MRLRTSEAMDSPSGGRKGVRGNVLPARLVVVIVVEIVSVVEAGVWRTLDVIVVYRNVSDDKETISLT